MFVVTCQRSQKRTLLGVGSIQRIHDTAIGPVAIYLCACGDLELWHGGSSYPVEGTADPLAGGAAIVRAVTISAAVGA